LGVEARRAYAAIMRSAALALGLLATALGSACGGGFSGDAPVEGAPDGAAPVAEGGASAPGSDGGGGEGGAQGPVRRAVAFALGGRHSCVLTDEAKVKCWGANEAGQLGLDDTKARGAARADMGAALPYVALGAKAISLAAGDAFTCAILAGGAVKCWGANAKGQLGVGDTRARGSAAGEMSALAAVPLGAKAVRVVAGREFACALLEGGKVKCWGDASKGQLGNGDANVNLGDQPGEIEGASVDLGGDASALVAGADHACAILVGGALKCWGRNSDGQLGLGNNGSYGNDPDEMGVNLPPVPVPSPALAVEAGDVHTCALLSDRVACWGHNSSGQLGLGSTEPKGLAEGEVAALVGVDLGGAKPQLVAARGARSCVTTLDGSLRCWGANDKGQLGVGSVESRGDQSGEMGAALTAVELGEPVVALGLGVSHSCAALAGGAVKCWGDNSGGQLGVGDTRARGASPGEMGAALPAVSLGL
jgi:hypothetical protein